MISDTNKRASKSKRSPESYYSGAIWNGGSPNRDISLNAGTLAHSPVRVTVTSPSTRTSPEPTPLSPRSEWNASTRTSPENSPPSPRRQRHAGTSSSPEHSPPSPRRARHISTPAKIAHNPVTEPLEMQEFSFASLPPELKQMVIMRKMEMHAREMELEAKQKELEANQKQDQKTIDLQEEVSTVDQSGGRPTSLELDFQEISNRQRNPSGDLSPIQPGARDVSPGASTTRECVVTDLGPTLLKGGISHLLPRWGK